MLLRGPREQPPVSQERPPSALSPTRLGATVCLPLLQGAAAVKNIKAVFPGDGREHGGPCMARRPAWFPRSWGRAGLCVCHGGTAVAQGPGRAPQGAGVLGPLGRLGALTVTLPWGSLAVTSLQGRGRGELPPSCPSAPPVTALLSGFPETHRLPVSSLKAERGPAITGGGPWPGSGGCPPPHSPSVAHSCTPSGKGL